MTDSRILGKAVFAALSLLIIGAALGIGIDRHRIQPDARNAAMQMHEQPFAVMDSALSLRPDQRGRVHAIIIARQADIEGVWQDTHERLLAILDSTMTDLEVVLDTGQITRLHELAQVLHGGVTQSLPGH